MAITAAQLNVRFTSEGASQVKSDLDGVGQGVARTATGFDKMKGAALGMGTALIVPMGIGLKAAVQLEQAVANVNASLGGLDSGTLDKLSASFQKIGADSKFSATEVAAVADELAKAGFGAEELLDGMTRAVVDLSQATGEGLPIATKGITQAFAMWSEEIVGAEMAMTDASVAADILTNAANSSAGGVESVIGGMRNFGPTAASVGLGFDEASAAIALFTNYGYSGSEAGTKLSRAIQFMAAPTDKAAKKMQELGISAFDSQGQFIGFPALFDNLQTSMAGMSDEATASALKIMFGAEAYDAMQLAVKAGGDPLREMEKLMTKTGSAAEQSALRMDTLGAQFDTLKEGVTTFLGSLVQGLIPGMRLLVDTANVLVDVLMAIPAPIKMIIGAIAGSLAAFAAVTRSIQAFNAISLLTGGKTIGVMMASLAGLIPIVLAVAAVAGVLYLAWKTNFLGIRDVVGKVVDGVTGFFDRFRDAFDKARKPVSDVMDTVNKIGGIAGKATKPMNVLSAGMVALSKAIKGINGGDLPDWLETVADGLDTGADAVQDFLDAFTDTFDSFETLTGFVSTSEGVFAQYESTINSVSRVLYSLGVGLRAVADITGFGWIGALALGFAKAGFAVDELVQRFQGLRALGLNPVSAALIAIGTTFESLAPLMNNISGYVGNLANAFQAFLAGDFGAGFDALGAAIVNLANAWKEIGNLALDVVISIGSWAFEQAVDLGSAFASWITDTAIPAIDRTARSLGTMAVSIADWAVDALIDLGGKVSSWITDTALPAVDKAARSLGTFLVEIAGWLVTASIDLGTKVGSWIRDTALPGVDKAARSLGTFIVDIAGWLVTTSIDLGTKVGSWIRDTALPGVDKAARDLGTFIVNIIGWLVTTSIDLGTKVASWIRDTALPGVDKAARDLGTFLVNIAGWLVTTSIDLGTKVGAWIRDTALPAVDKTARDLGTFIVNIAGWLVTTTIDLATKVSDWIVNTALPAVDKTARDLGTFIVNIAGWLVTETTDLATSIKAKIVEGVGALSITSTDVITVGTKLVTAIGDALGAVDWASAAVKVFEGIGTALGAGVAGVVNATAGIMQWLGDAIAGLDGEAIGSQVGNFLGQAIIGAVGLAGSAIVLIGIGLKNLFETAFNDIDWSSVASGALSLLGNAFVFTGEFLVGLTSGLGTAFTDAFVAIPWSDIGASLSEAVTGMMETAFAGIAQIVADALNPIIEDVNSVIETINNIPGMVDISTIPLFDSISEDAGAAKMLVDDLAASLTGLMALAGGGLGDAAANAFGPSGGGGASGIGGGGPAYSAGPTSAHLARLQEAQKAQGGGGGGQFAGMLAEIETLRTALTNLGTSFTTAQTNVTTFVSTTIGVMGGWAVGLGVMFTTLGTTFTTASLNLTTLQTAFTTFVATTIGVMGGWIIGLGVMFLTFSTALTTASLSLTTFQTAVVTFVATTIGVLGGWIIGLGVMFLTFSTTLTTASLALTTFQTGIVTFVATTIGVMGGWIVGLGVMFMTLGTALTTAGVNIVTFQTAIVTFVATTIGVMGGWIGGISTMMATFGTAMAGGESDVRSFASEVSTQMGAVSRSVSSGMSEASSAISAEAGSWPGLISAVEGSMRSAGVGVGAAASSGVADGILSVMWRVTAAANMIVGEVQRAMNAKAKIASPSKMTAHIGEQIGWGLALGIDHTIPLVTSKAQQMVDLLKDVLSASMPNPLAGLTGLVSEGDRYFKRQIGVLGGAIIGDWEKLTQGFWRNITSGMVQKGILAEDGSYVNPGFYSNNPPEFEDWKKQWTSGDRSLNWTQYKQKHGVTSDVASAPPLPTQAPIYAKPPPIHVTCHSTPNETHQHNTFLVVSRELLEGIEDTVEGFKVLTSPAEVAAAQGRI